MFTKRKEDWGPCGDYRKLNSVTVLDRYPVPHTQNCLQVLEGKKIFSTLDLAKVYHQIPVLEDVPKTAVATPFGLFEFLHMPFGLSNAAATFQRFIHHVLSGMDFCVPYFDDVLVASESEIQHLEHLKQVFQRFEEYGVRLNASKCALGKSSVKFLGHIVIPDGITPLPEKVSAITDFPEPSTIKELRRFLALINFYRRFVPNAARTQAVLNVYLKGTKKNDKTPITWTEEARNAHLKSVKMTWQRSLSCTILLSLSPAQRRYSAYDRELLAAYMAIKYFRHMVEDRSFILFTDHKPLTFAFRQKEDKCSPRQLDIIGQFTTVLRHLNGTDNAVADALSRIHISTIGLPSVIDFQKISEEQKTDPELQNILSSNKTSLAVSAHSFKKILESISFFYKPTFTFTYRIRASVKKVTYVWHSIRADATLWARTCLQCQQRKVSRHTRSNLSGFVPPSARFDHAHIDLVGPLPPSEGFRYCLTCVDRFSKWPEAFPLVDISANTIATAFYSGWIFRFGPPLRLTTDQGTQFESALFQALTKFLGTARQRTTSYHPAANGQVERIHRQLKASIMAHG
ncbi:Transposon Ty3-I Gag-Pol polyprotein [Araneus ventricosus]|uniref:Transposon Ty3-I Gag-Pol polyprotein n=1 Tax=Araneus ventricosus TaxID=182803 RepID=A0A4Y2A291_ARAVE|nr:Transposon Ty3-I Gag-Pol polyprotein [Araneus ventricosus]